MTGELKEPTVLDHSKKSLIPDMPVTAEDVHADLNFPSAKMLRESSPKMLEWWVVRSETKKHNNDGWRIWHWKDYKDIGLRLMPTEMEAKLIEMGYKVAVESDRTKWQISWEEEPSNE